MTPAGNTQRHRTAGLCRAGAASGYFEAAQTLARRSSDPAQTDMSSVAQFPTPFIPTESQLHMAYSVCRGITRSQAKNFYYGFLVLPKRKRQALCAVYAFMRRCDDIADDPALSARDRKQKLDTWLDAFHAAHTGHPTDDPVLLAVVDAQRRFGIPVGLLDQLAFGTAMDVDKIGLGSRCIDPSLASLRQRSSSSPQDDRWIGLSL